MPKNNLPWIIDFETTVYDGQEKTEVWAAAAVELYSDDVHVFHSIDELFLFFVGLKRNVVALTHNLKFDGCFWLDYAMKGLKYEQAVYKDGEGNYHFIDKKDMRNNTFQYLISNMGQWYRIIFKVKNHYIEIRDSLKLLPFSVKEIGKAFNTSVQKTEIEYEGKRFAGCEITDKEREYIANDVKIVKEAMESMYLSVKNSVTIGSACLKDFKKTVYRDEWPRLFPQLEYIDLSKSVHDFGAKEADEYIRKSYKGGWCYVVRGKEKKIYKNGITLDVNSLYPSVMLSESGNKYPLGSPVFLIGDKVLSYLGKETYYCFIRFKCRFYLKENYLPFVQIKNNLLYKSTEMLETSDVWIEALHRHERYIFDGNERIDTCVTLTMTETDFDLFREHYYTEDLEILDGAVFFSNFYYGEEQIFDKYITKWREIKENSTGPRRTLAKLYSNNLYGKLATSPNSSFKVAYIKDDGSLGFYTQLERAQKTIYVPIGSAITSHARNYTIKAAQSNYYGKDKPGFIYADTDSIHLDLDVRDVKGVVLDEKKYGAWKCESKWETGFFVRQKTYMELEENGVSIKCAGLPEKCKNLVGYSMGLMKMPPNLWDKLSWEEKKFVVQDREVTDYNVGLRVPGKLVPKRIDGGVILKETDYLIR